MQTSYDFATLEKQAHDETISPEGAAWLDGYNVQRTADIHAEGYVSGGADITELATAPDKIPAEYVTYWNAGAQESRDNYTDNN